MSVRLIMGLIAGMACAGAPAPAALLTLSPDADAFVNQSTAATNYGSTHPLQLKNNTDAFDRKVYLRYAVGASLATVSDATLELTVATSSGDAGGLGGARTFELYALKEDAFGNDPSWSESTINWSNAPANDAGGSFTPAATFLTTAAAASAATKVTFTAAAIKDFLNDDTDGFVTFMVFRSNNNATVDYFSSREASSGKPTLTVTTVPEPTAVFGTATVVGALAMRRRRRG